MRQCRVRFTVKYRRLVVISRVHIYLVLQTPLHHLRLITFIIRHLFTHIHHSSPQTPSSSANPFRLNLSALLSTCPHNMVNFGPLAAEIVSLVWGTPR